MKRKKILSISHDFVKKVNFRFYEEWSKDKKFKITCLSPTFFYEANKKIYSDHRTHSKLINFVKKKIIFKKSRIFYFENLKKEIKKIRPDIVILHNDPVSVQSFILIFFSFFYEYKLCYFTHENNLINFFQKISIKKFLKILILYFLNLIIKFRVSHIFCISNQIKKNYEFLGYKNKTVLIPLGYDEKIFNLKKRNKHKSKRYFTISYFGRISKVKGIHTLVEALSKIKFNFNFMLDVDLIEDKKYFKDLTFNLRKILPRKRIFFIKCNHTTIANYMSKSDLVVVPSMYEEQYGRVIQESVACGSLVIGSRVGAIPEIIKDNDLLFNSNSPKELSIVINRLKNKSFFKMKLKNIYQRILKERTINKQLLIIKKLNLFK